MGLLSIWNVAKSKFWWTLNVKYTKNLAYTKGCKYLYTFDVDSMLRRYFGYIRLNTVKMNFAVSHYGCQNVLDDLCASHFFSVGWR